MALPDTYKKSLQTMEGKLALAFNSVYGFTLVVASFLEFAKDQPVFANHGDQFIVLTGIVAAFNAAYAAVRSSYKAALSKQSDILA